MYVHSSVVKLKKILKNKFLFILMKIKFILKSDFIWYFLFGVFLSKHETVFLYEMYLLILFFWIRKLYFL